MVSDLIIFLHALKCGGTFFTGGIRNSYKSEETCLHNVNQNSSLSYFNRSEKDQKKVKFYHGHFNFGYHKELFRPAVYVTILRDPIDRLLSNYYNLREEKCKNNTLHKIFHTYSLEECLSRSCWNKLSNIETLILSNFIDNHQVRILSNSFRLPREIKEKFNSGQKVNSDNYLISEKDYLVAINNLKESFSFIGLCHETDSYWPMLNQRFGFKIPPECWVSSDWRFSNKSKKHPMKKDLSKETIEMFYEFDKYDLKLYQYAKENMSIINSRPIIVVP
jgi:hypothetical protein